jgi:hypothetical protein
MSALDKCIESLAFCHLQDEPRWAAARVIVQQDIDAYIETAASLAEKRDALELLMKTFSEKFPDESSDPVLVRSYIRRQLRRAEYDLRQEERGTSAESLEAVPSNASADPEQEASLESPSLAIGQQFQDERSHDSSDGAHRENRPEKTRTDPS